MFKYIVVKGDTLSSIAQRFRIDDWRTQIYDHPANAAFKMKRPDPDLIYPKDELWIPADEPKTRTGDRNAWSYKVESIDTTIGVQHRLNNAGFDSGPEDDINGPKTTGAVKRFQQYCKDHCNSRDPNIIDSGPVDGIVGPKTKAALIKYYGV